MPVNVHLKCVHRAFGVLTCQIAKPRIKVTSEFFRALEMDGDELKDHYEELEDDFLVRAMADTGDDGMQRAAFLCSVPVFFLQANQVHY